MTPVALPPIPTLTSQQRERWANAVGRLQGVDEIVDRGPADVLRHLAHRQLVESLATVGPLRPGSLPLVLPPRRRFLAEDVDVRRRACEAALTHVDTRLAMLDSGHLDELVGSDTPTVLHGMIEAGDTRGRRSNAGLVRLSDVRFNDEKAEFTPPPGRVCPALVAELIRLTNAGPRLGHEPIEVASWLAAAFMSVHPFVDGNGRTARSLFQLVHSAGIGGFDWVSIEAWASDRSLYIAALQDATNRSAGGWFPDRIDVSAFLEFAVGRFQVGAKLHERRARWCADAWDDERVSGLDADVRRVALVVAIDRNASARELVGVVDRPVSHVVDELLARGLVRRDGLGLQPEGPMVALRARAEHDA